MLSRSTRTAPIDRGPVSAGTNADAEGVVAVVVGGLELRTESRIVGRIINARTRPGTECGAECLAVA
jgi:hypothetical protein